MQLTELTFRTGGVMRHIFASDEFIEQTSDEIFAHMLRRQTSADVMTDDQKTARWWAFNTKALSDEMLFKSELYKLFTDQQIEVMEKLEGSKSVKAVNDWLFDRGKWIVRFSEMGQLLLPRFIEERGNEELGTLVVGVDFDVTNPRVVAFLKRKIPKFSFKVNDTTLDQLKKELTVGVDAGESIPKLAKRVEKVFSHAKGYRSVRIARTEVIGSSNFGAFESYKQSGGIVERKEWLATKDDRVRDTHAAIDGQRRKLNERFSNGLQHPGDPSGRPESIINCRCTILPIVKE